MTRPQGQHQKQCHHFSVSSLPQGTVHWSEEPQEAGVGAWSFLPLLVLCYEDIIVSSILYVIAGLVPDDVSCVSLASPLSSKSTGGLNPRIRLVQLSTT